MNKIDSTLLKENIDSKVCILNCQNIKSTQSQDCVLLRADTQSQAVMFGQQFI